MAYAVVTPPSQMPVPDSALPLQPPPAKCRGHVRWRSGMSNVVIGDDSKIEPKSYLWVMKSGYVITNYSSKIKTLQQYFHPCFDLTMPTKLCTDGKCLGIRGSSQGTDLEQVVTFKNI